MRVLVCGEGTHDIGHSRWDGRAGQHVQMDGWLQCLVRKYLPEAEIIAISQRDLVTLPRGNQHRPLPPGHGTKALMAKLKARAEKFDLLIFMADADTNVSQEYATRRGNIVDGFDRLDSPPSVPCVPMSTSESWLISSTEGWLTVGLADTGVLPNHPEACWGARNDPDADHPHQYFKRICHEAGASDSRETRVTIASAALVDTLLQKCPRSFGDFDAGMIAAIA